MDIGANIEYTSTVFSGAISSGFKVYAFEPDDRNFKSLKEIVKLRKKIGKIIPIKSAAGETKGTIKFGHNENHHGDHRIVWCLSLEKCNGVRS